MSYVDNTLQHRKHLENRLNGSNKYHTKIVEEMMLEEIKETKLLNQQLNLIKNREYKDLPETYLNPIERDFFRSGLNKKIHFHKRSVKFINQLHPNAFPEEFNSKNKNQIPTQVFKETDSMYFCFYSYLFYFIILFIQIFIQIFIVLEK